MSAVLTIVGIIAAVLLGGTSPFLNSTVNNGSGSSGTDFSAVDACKPSINKNRQIKVQVKNGLEPIYSNNVSHPEFNKTEKTYVLVKENATIPAWKVILESRTGRFGNPNLQYAEMEHLGTAVSLSGEQSNPDVGKDTYIGIGWCDPQTGTAYGAGLPNSCLDPLVQDVIYVVSRKGAESSDGHLIDCPELGSTDSKEWLLCHRWGEEPENFNDPAHNEENLDKYWWSFNVYYDASKLPADPSYQDLPCWMRELAKNCPGGGDVGGRNRLDADSDPNCEAGDVLGVVSAQGSADTQRPRLIINKNEMTITNPPSGIEIADYYISVGKLTEEPNDPIIGTAYANHFHLRLRRGNVSGTSTDHVLILDPSLSGHDGPYWTFAPILGTNKPLANTLQLGTFSPGIPSFFYEWWTPSCKPALYFYPEKETEISVKVLPEGYITESIPEYGNGGWKAIAYPDGKILYPTTNLSSMQAGSQLPITYNYLYYEAAVKNVAVPKNKGWIVEKENLAKFFSFILPKLGLNNNEQEDFRSYWLPKLAEDAKWYITLINQDELDRVERLEIFPKPDNIIRVRFYFEKINENEIAKLGNSEIRKFEDFYLFGTSDLGFRILKPRSGFTVVDWGGIIGNGSCGMEEVSQ